MKIILTSIFVCSLAHADITSCIGNGVTDDTACINSAEAALESGGGGTLTFPSGKNYCISDNLLIQASNIVWQLSGSQISVCTVFSDAPISGGVAAAINIISSGTISNIKILNGAIYGKNVAGDPKGISSCRATNVEINGVTITHFQTAGIWPACLPQGTGWNIHGNTITSVGSAADPGAIVINLDSSTVQSNTINTSYSGIGINGVNDSILNNTLVDNLNSSLGVGGNDVHPVNSLVSGNSVTIHVAGIPVTAIRLGNDPHQTAIRNNTIALVISGASTVDGFGIYSTDTNLNDTIDGCVIDGNTVTLDAGGSSATNTAILYAVDGGSNCIWSNNSATVTNENTSILSRVFGLISSTGKTIHAIMQNNTVSGVSGLVGPPYAFDLNNAGGGTLVYNVSGLTVSGGYIRYGATILSGSQYYNTPLSFSNWGTLPSGQLRGNSAIRGQGKIR